MVAREEFLPDQGGFWPEPAIKAHARRGRYPLNSGRETMRARARGPAFPRLTPAPPPPRRAGGRRRR